jgi:hypothetical protein
MVIKSDYDRDSDVDFIALFKLAMGFCPEPPLN